MSSYAPHIIRDFDQAIRALRGDVLTMAGTARINVERAIRSLLERDDELARTVIADDTDVDELEQRIDQLGMDILVRFHPVATDLRMVISSMKIAINLERISDHAVNIAKRARKMVKRSELSQVNLVEPLYTQADQILRDAVTAFNDHDIELGRGLNARDKILDAAYKRVTAQLSECLEESNGRGEDYLHLIFAARSLERIGDLAVNIGEDAVFLESARDIRHAHRKTLEEDLGETA